MTTPDLTDCDREPIHVPGAIQPHGVLLAFEPATWAIHVAAGPTEAMLGGRPEDLLGRAVDEIFPAARFLLEEGEGYVGLMQGAGGEPFDATVHASGGLTLLELEPSNGAGDSGMALLAALERADAAMEAAADMEGLCDRAAQALRRLTGFERVMIYRFLDDGAGRVVAEARDPEARAFLHHHFPATDIPRQARALYLRNRIRVIPDAGYTPWPLVSAEGPEAAAAFDLSDSVLRSVSPIHLAYLKNMGVGASASVSIVRDGALWGLAAFHHPEPRLMPHGVRAVCRSIAASLSRRLRALEETVYHRDRARLRNRQDAILARAEAEPHQGAALLEGLEELLGAVDAHGVAVRIGDRMAAQGMTPPAEALPPLFDWLKGEAGKGVFTSHRLGAEYEPAQAWTGKASGVAAVSMGGDAPAQIAWFRAERLQEVIWAGDPHKAMNAESGMLTPRASFAEWAQTVRGQAKPFSHAEVEAVRSLAEQLQELHRRRAVQDMNRRLAAAVADRDEQLAQKDFLLREVNHRVQNNLQLVSSFLGVQRRQTIDPVARAQLEEAARRMRAVGLLHRRLYQSDEVRAVDMDRYLDELARDLLGTVDAQWANNLRIVAAPVRLPTDRAVTIGLVVTELMLNAIKYAYEGRAGPIEVSLDLESEAVRVAVSDQGVGRGEGVSDQGGFGSQVLHALVRQLGGRLAYLDNGPGTRALLTVPAR
ncbi:histidine kinase dimerization/phosphoacceptor domain -containing protein [Brevundimonas sp. 2R-24]|uniref:Histidine kinase dimerization/phosphoacceptor domain -containing protein n=1 Tax=Peiella sedimenti TaxID=3061083 RepID=A0ABT8SKT4_9CAUL|nr:histidine kinase dimerization/phosphoacceptor domain -containing protein [Caulobacteraceae bacterium XZ-24]